MVSYESSRFFFVHLSVVSYESSRFFFVHLSAVSYESSVLSLFVPHPFFVQCFRKMLASLAQSDARPTVDQEVASSIPAGSATFFRGD